MFDAVRSGVGSSGYPSDYWVNVPLVAPVALEPDANYWFAARAADGSDSFMRWLRPSTDVVVVNAYRNSAVADGEWNYYVPYDPVAFEIIGEPALVPEPGTASLLLLGAICFMAASGRSRRYGGAAARAAVDEAGSADGDR